MNVRSVGIDRNPGLVHVAIGVVSLSMNVSMIIGVCIARMRNMLMAIYLVIDVRRVVAMSERFMFVVLIVILMNYLMLQIFN